MYVVERAALLLDQQLQLLHAARAAYGPGQLLRHVTQPPWGHLCNRGLLLYILRAMSLCLVVVMVLLLRGSLSASHSRSRGGDSCC